MRAHNQSSIFSTGGKFCLDYGLLLELHTLTLVARSYALLDKPVGVCFFRSILYKSSSSMSYTDSSNKPHYVHVLIPTFPCVSVETSAVSPSSSSLISSPRAAQTTVLICTHKVSD